MEDKRRRGMYDNISNFQNNVFSTFCLRKARLKQQTNCVPSTTVKSCLVDRFLRTRDHVRPFSLVPVIFASSSDASSCDASSSEWLDRPPRRSHDAEIGAHIALYNLKYDDEEAIESANNCIKTETGQDRLKQLIHVGDNDEMSEELENFGTVVKTVALVSFLFGVGMSMSNFREDFRDRNKLTKFDTRMVATRKMNDVVYVRSFLEGCRWTTRLTFFTASFISVSHAVAIYRNRSSGFEYGIGGAVTGMLLRFNRGIKAMVAAGIIAGTMGIAAGVLIYPLQTLLGEKQDQRHFRDIYKHRLYEIKLKRLQTQPVT